MNLNGKKVIHKVFGEGVVLDYDDSHVTVQFLKKDELKKFKYPSCFEEHIKLKDEDTATQISKVIEEYEKEERKRQEEKVELFMTGRDLESSRLKKAIKVRSFDTVDEFCREYKREIFSEVKYLRKEGGKRYNIFDGKRIEFKSGRYTYTFETDDELNYPEGTQIFLWKNNTSISGTVLGCEEFTIIVSTGVDLGEDIPSLEFSAESWRLLNSLGERLDEVLSNPGEIVRSLICDGPRSIDYGSGKVRMGQENAVRMSESQPITFVWGPPGTGKTQTLAKIAVHHIQKGHKVLMLSYSNVSVDGAVMRTYKLFPEKRAGKLLRYGHARESVLLEHEYLTSYNLAIHNHPELIEERDRLMRERKKLSRDSQEYIKLERRLSDIRKGLLSEEKAALKKASFVATTVSKAVIDKTLREGGFDVVIFDEASMAYIPQVVFSASLAKKSFICMGDFRQLPPIVQSDNGSVLNGDIFQYCGITKAIDGGQGHKWLCMLNKQYRMHPDISNFASKMMYNGLLHSAEGMREERQDIVSVRPMPGNALGIADLSGMMSVCMKTTDNSRINVLSAMISFSLALQAAEKHEVGIITPYHAQARLFRSMARDAASVTPESKPISCATVHQFQGSEKDHIIYDAVDCYRMPYPGMLLTSSTNNYANRLFNVALIRAKGKFIGIANVMYMDNKNLSRNLLFKNLLDDYGKKQGCLKGESLFSQKSSSKQGFINFYNEKKGNLHFLEDIVKAKHEIRIDIPDETVEEEFLEKISRVLEEKKKRGVKVYVRVEDKRMVPSCIRRISIENTFVANPIVIIDKKTVWFGVPKSGAQFKAEGSVLPTKYRPIIRFVGKATASSLYGFLGMSNTVDQSKSVVTDDRGEAITTTFATHVLANKSCPHCGKAMKLQKSKKGKFFLACTGYPLCNKTELINIETVEDYIYEGKGKRCLRCNNPLEVKLGPYGLYIQCCGYPPHRYKINEI